MKKKAKFFEDKPTWLLGRCRVISDNDGHEYIIPAGRDDDFYKWVEAEENCTKPPKLDFEPIRINCSVWTFTDPQGY